MISYKISGVDGHYKAFYEIGNYHSGTLYASRKHPIKDIIKELHERKGLNKFSNQSAWTMPKYKYSSIPQRYSTMLERIRHIPDYWKIKKFNIKLEWRKYDSL